MSEGGSKLDELEARLRLLAAKVRGELPDRARTLREALTALEGGDETARETVRRTAHMVRGTAGSHGMTNLTEPAAAVETAAKGGADLATLRALTTTLADALDETAREAVVAPTHARAPAAPSSGLVKPLVGRSVLAIDDDPATRRLLGMTLSNLGGATTAVEETADAFFARLDAHAYDVIVVDAMMPDHSGLDLLERIAGSPLARPNARYFVLSAAAADELGWTLPSALRVGWLRKPFRPRDLLDAIQNALAG